MSYEISNHIASIGTATMSEQGRELPPNVYLIHDGKEGILVDSGIDSKESTEIQLNYLNAQAIDLQQIVLTHHHMDHMGGAERLRQATGACVSMHRQERFLLDKQQTTRTEDWSTSNNHAIAQTQQGTIETTIDRWLLDGDTIPVNELTLQVVHSPGHTLGSICLYLPQERVMFTGDTVPGIGTTAVMPPPIGDMALYFDSLIHLKTYDVSLLLPGHGPVITNPQQKLQELLDHRRRREEQIMDLVSNGISTPQSILRSLYSEVGSHVRQLALWQIEAHLAKLSSEGRIHHHDEGYALS